MNLKNTVRTVKLHEQVYIVVGIMMEPHDAVNRTVFSDPSASSRKSSLTQAYLLRLTSPIAWTGDVSSEWTDGWGFIKPLVLKKDLQIRIMTLSQSLLHVSSRNRAAITKCGSISFTSVHDCRSRVPIWQISSTKFEKENRCTITEK